MNNSLPQKNRYQQRILIALGIILLVGVGYYSWNHQSGNKVITSRSKATLPPSVAKETVAKIKPQLNSLEKQEYARQLFHILETTQDRTEHALALQTIIEEQLDGRFTDRANPIQTSGMNYGTRYEVALDEICLQDEEGRFSIMRLDPQTSREALAEKAHQITEENGVVALPTFYPTKTPRLDRYRRIFSGELVAKLKDGADGNKIASDLGLNYLGTKFSSEIHYFSGSSTINVLEKQLPLALHDDVISADISLLASVEQKQARRLPNDPFFTDCWHLANNGKVRSYNGTRAWDINIITGKQYPYASFRFANADGLENTIYDSVWGDLKSANDGIRGRGVRVGIIDDGIDRLHPDLDLASGSSAGESLHHAYDTKIVITRDSGQKITKIEGQINGKSGLLQANHDKGENIAHGTLAAGIIAAKQDNGEGMVGVAPKAMPVGIKVIRRLFLPNLYDQSLSANFLPRINNLNSKMKLDLLYQAGGIKPASDLDYFPEAVTSDLAIAASLLYQANPGTRISNQVRTNLTSLFLPGETQFGLNTPFEILPTDSATEQNDAMIQVKYLGFGSADIGTFQGPGVETINAMQEVYKNGRGGRGTVIVAAAGNGRVSRFEDANLDGYVNRHEVICVGGVAHPLSADSGDDGGNSSGKSYDPISRASEPGACVAVCAPDGGEYWSDKRKRVLDVTKTPDASSSGVTTGALRSGQRLITTDWSINEPSDSVPNLTLNGVNGGASSTIDYANDDYTRRTTGTSLASAMVSGVVALMLEANPRLKAIDVKHILMRTAQMFCLREQYLAGQTIDWPIKSSDGSSKVGLNFSYFNLDQDNSDPDTLNQGWRRNGANIWFNNKYGAGMVNAKVAVDAATSSGLFPPENEVLIQSNRTMDQVVKVLDSNDLRKIDLTWEEVVAKTSNITFFDFNIDTSSNPRARATTVEIKISAIGSNDRNFPESKLSDLTFFLISPKGTLSILSEARLRSSNEFIINVSFSSLHYFGEDPNGRWRLGVFDLFNSNTVAGDVSVINPSYVVDFLGGGNKLLNGRPLSVDLIIHNYTAQLKPVIDAADLSEKINPTDVNLVPINENAPLYFPLTTSEDFSSPQIKAALSGIGNAITNMPTLWQSMPYIYPKVANATSIPRYKYLAADGLPPGLDIFYIPASDLNISTNNVNAAPAIQIKGRPVDAGIYFTQLVARNVGDINYPSATQQPDPSLRASHLLLGPELDQTEPNPSYNLTTNSGSSFELVNKFTHINTIHKNSVTPLNGTSQPINIVYDVNPDPYEAWARFYFSGGRYVNIPASAKANPEEDHDCDGNKNYLEFALGTNPLIPDAGKAIELVETENEIKFSFNMYPERSINGVGLGEGRLPYEIQVSSDLQTWQTVSRDDNVLGSGNNAGKLIVGMTQPVALPNNQKNPSVSPLNNASTYVPLAGSASRVTYVIPKTDAPKYVRVKVSAYKATPIVINDVPSTNNTKTEYKIYPR